MDREVIQQKREMEVLREQVLSLKQQARVDREAQKQAIQAQKQQTKDSEEKLRVQLQDMVGLLSTVRILLMIGQRLWQIINKINTLAMYLCQLLDYCAYVHHKINIQSFSPKTVK